jgi:hypothetical protein
MTTTVLQGGIREEGTGNKREGPSLKATKKTRFKNENKKGI